MKKQKAKERLSKALRPFYGPNPWLVAVGISAFIGLQQYSVLDALVAFTVLMIGMVGARYLTIAQEERDRELRVLVEDQERRV